MITQFQMQQQDIGVIIKAEQQKRLELELVMDSKKMRLHLVLTMDLQAQCQQQPRPPIRQWKRLPVGNRYIVPKAEGKGNARVTLRQPCRNSELAGLIGDALPTRLNG